MAKYRLGIVATGPHMDRSDLATALELALKEVDMDIVSLLYKEEPTDDGE